MDLLTDFELVLELLDKADVLFGGRPDVLERQQLPGTRPTDRVQHAAGAHADPIDDGVSHDVIDGRAYFCVIHQRDHVEHDVSPLTGLLPTNKATIACETGFFERKIGYALFPYFARPEIELCALPVSYFATPLRPIRCSATVRGMIHENLSQSIEDLSARIIAIRDSL